MYLVKLEKFEGPLDLLLDLIEQQKLDVTELNLAHVADQYLDYIKDNQLIQLENLANFLSVAAKLILIKSRALLPALKLSEEEEEEIRDLTNQLEEYKKFKEISQKIGELSLSGCFSFSRPGYQGVKTVFYPPENITAFDLKKNFLKVLAEIPQVEKMEEEVVGEIITLEERISDLEIVLRKRVETCFSEIVSEAKDKIDLIVSFLAMLEMIKQRLVWAEQKELFQEIKLSLKQKNQE